MEGARVRCLTGELELHLLQLRPSAAKKKKKHKKTKKWERNKITGSEVLVVYYRDKAGKVVGGCQRGSSVKLRP